MRLDTQKQMPKFQEYLLNEIYKQKGDATKISLEERLSMAYTIIKGNDKIYKKMVDNDFFKSFLLVSKSLMFATDKQQTLDIIPISYKLLSGNEDIQYTYNCIMQEINNVQVIPYHNEVKKKHNFK